MVHILTRRVEIFWVIFLHLVLLPGMLHAQRGAEDYLVVERMSRESGLPDQDINGISFDSKGYAWISTFGGGLVRYDGDSFIRFSKKTDPNSVGDFVSQCCEDDYGRLWVPDAGSMNLLD
jgi:Two component regulator propeller.